MNSIGSGSHPHQLFFMSLLRYVLEPVWFSCRFRVDAWMTKSNKFVYTQLADKWPKPENWRGGKSVQFGGSHRAWPRRAVNPLGLKIYYWKLWNLDFLLGRTWACRLMLRTPSSEPITDTRPDSSACPPRFLQNRRRSLCPEHPVTFSSMCVRDPSNFAVIGRS